MASLSVVVPKPMMVKQKTPWAGKEAGYMNLPFPLRIVHLISTYFLMPYWNEVIFKTAVLTHSITPIILTDKIILLLSGSYF